MRCRICSYHDSFKSAESNQEFLAFERQVSRQCLRRIAIVVDCWFALNPDPRGVRLKLGLVYAAIPRLCLYSIGLRKPSETLIRFALYQRMYESTISMN